MSAASDGSETFGKQITAPASLHGLRCFWRLCTCTFINLHLARVTDLHLALFLVTAIAMMVLYLHFRKPTPGVGL